MAIDMIENNELGALSQSRMSGFADDRYSNLLGLNFDIAGIKSAKRKTQETSASVSKSWAIDPTREKDCNYLLQKLTEVQNQLTYELSKNPNKKARQRYVNPLLDAEKNLKNASLRNNCEQKKAQEEEDKFKRETEDAIKRASESSPEIPKVQVAKGSRITKIVLIGVGLLVVGVVAVKLFKKN